MSSRRNVDSERCFVHRIAREREKEEEEISCAPVNLISAKNAREKRVSISAGYYSPPPIQIKAIRERVEIKKKISLNIESSCHNFASRRRRYGDVCTDV